MNETNKKTKRKMKKGISLMIFLVALSVFVYAGYNLVHIWIQNHQESTEKSHLLDVAGIPDDLSKPFVVNWKELQAINPDIIAWILIPDTEISYPIVQGQDNDYYLTHTAEKKSNYAGSVFMDYQAKNDFSDYNTFIYAHNVLHGTMFAEIKNYKDPDFFKKHPYVYVFTPSVNYRTEVIEIASVDTTSPAYSTPVATGQGLIDYVNMVKQYADIRSDVEVGEKDHIITLSTCSYETDNEDARYLLFAKLVPWDGTYIQK